MKFFSIGAEPSPRSRVGAATGLPKSPQTPGPSPSEADRKVGFFFGNAAAGCKPAGGSPVKRH
jgi:hypothetical protein